MRLKLDENLPESLVDALGNMDQDADNVRQEGLTGDDDLVVWAAAQSAGRYFITQDLDFADLRKFRPGTHCGVLLVRQPGAGRSELNRRIVEIFQTEDVGSWQGCFVVLSNHKLRVIRPNDE